MRKKEDEFKQSVRKLLAGRVGWRCSNPLCRKITCGPKGSEELEDIGEAAHICAAAPGGKRFNINMTSEERSSFHNGIWLCRNCAKMIDGDEKKYTVSLLKEWKENAEETTEAEIRMLSPNEIVGKDREILKFIKSCMDRPAFMDDIMCECSMEDLSQALEDTIIAINTGVLKDRHGKIIKKKEGKSSVQNVKWREKLDAMVYLIDAMRRRIQIAEADGEYCSRDGFVIFRNRKLAEWLNFAREDMLEQFSEICYEAGIGKIHFQKRGF